MKLHSRLDLSACYFQTVEKKDGILIHMHMASYAVLNHTFTLILVFPWEALLSVLKLIECKAQLERMQSSAFANTIYFG